MLMTVLLVVAVLCFILAAIPQVTFKIALLPVGLGFFAARGYLQSSGHD